MERNRAQGVAACAEGGKNLFVLAKPGVVSLNARVLKPEPSTMNWYYLDNGTQRGPITDADFAPLTQQGVINAGTFLWCEGMADWKTYADLTGAAVAAPTAVASAVAEPAAGLRVQREAAPAQAAQVGCTQCGAVVPREQLVVSGAAALCPKCVVSAHRGQFNYAPPPLRIVAWIIDWVIVMAVFGFGMLAMKWILMRTFDDSHLRGTIGVIFFGLLILWMISYFTLRVSRNGGTTGQTMLGMKVVTANGVPPSFLRALGRFLLCMIVNQFTLSLGQLTAFFDSQKRCVHDMVCGTVVLKK